MSFESPCGKNEFTSITETAQVNPTANKYDGQDFVFTYADFVVVPDFCDLDITCVDVSPVSAFVPCQELVSGGLTWNFDTDDYENGLAPGDYTFNF